MLDPKLLRNDLETVVQALGRRDYKLDADHFLALESRRKALQVETQDLQKLRNTRSKEIGRAKGAGEDIAPLLAEVDELGQGLKDKEIELSKLQSELHEWMMSIPNMPHESVPAGKDEADNEIVRTWGEPREFDFEIKDHVALGEASKGLQFDLASKLTGSRFVVMQSNYAQLHRALIQFMLDTHITEHGYTEMYVPYIVNEDSMRGTGQLPKFEEDLFRLNGEANFYLIPTAEVPITNLWRDAIAEEKELPLRYVCHTPCFRSEAGSYGKDTRGMIRQHQFEKVELVQLVKPSDSWASLESLLGHAEKILQKLDLPYRVVNLCTGDLGFSSTKTYDIEVWLPGQQAYREISSCSNFQDFQARRMKARWRNTETNKPELMHTLNGSGLAVGRTMLAIMENYQMSDGRIQIPTALRSYMHNKEFI